MEVKTDVCKGCGATIVWGKTPDGKSIPLDPRAPVYFQELKEDKSGYVATRGATMAAHQDGKEQLGFWAVSHFATCPKASSFSGAGKAKPAAPPQPAPAVPAGWWPLTSTNLNSCAFDGASQMGQPGSLSIQFKTGGIWKYSAVPDSVFEELKASTSPGKYFLDEIKGRFLAEKVSA